MQVLGLTEGLVVGTLSETHSRYPTLFLPKYHSLGQLYTRGGKCMYIYLVSGTLERVTSVLQTEKLRPKVGK